MVHVKNTTVENDPVQGVDFEYVGGWSEVFENEIIIKEGENLVVGNYIITPDQQKKLLEILQSVA